MNKENPQGLEECCVCNGKFFSKIFDIYDDRYGCPGSFFLAKCKYCGHVMLSSGIKSEELPSLYENYYPRRTVDSSEVLIQASQVNKKFSALFRWFNGTNNQAQYFIKQNQKYLDIGCGTGLSLVEGFYLGGVCYGIEADSNIRRLAETLNLEIHIGSIFDNPFPGTQFDLIAMNQVIEHLPNPREVLIEAKKRLSPTGRLVISFPNRGSFWCRLSGVKWINWHAPYHLQHFNKSGFVQLAKNCEFRISKVSTITPTIWTILQLRVLFQGSSPGIPNSLWLSEPIPGGTDLRKLDCTLSVVRRLTRRIISPPILTLLIIFNRLIDVFGLGDSVMVELTRVE